MRIINRYIARDFLVAFIVTLAIFMFVMAVGNMFRVIDLFARGVSGVLILKVFSYGIPFSLIFAIPMSVLAAVFLSFSRMSSDREIMAMQACGISIWQIIQPPIIMGALLTVVCIYINNDLAPASHYARRLVVEKLKVETPLSFLDEGRFIREIPGYTIYIGRKDGNRVHDVVIYEFGEAGASQTVRAETGEIMVDEKDDQRILINLYQVRIEQADDDDPGDLTLTRRISAQEYPVVFDMAELIRDGIVWKNRSDLSMAEIIDAIYGNLRFRPGDITDLPTLVQRLHRPPLVGVVDQVLSPETMEMLATLSPDIEPDADLLKEALTEEFNRLLDGPVIYSPRLFAGVELGRVTRELLESEPRAGPDLIRLNRMLLEYLFAGLVDRHYLSNLDEVGYRVSRTSLMVEASTRLALSFSCFAFVLLGAALGIKIQRRESSIGMGVTLLLVFVFYFFIILADSLVSKPHFYPHLIVWVPFVISEIIGFTLLSRKR